MHQLMGKDVREERLESNQTLLCGINGRLCYGGQNHPEFCLLDVLQHDPFAPLLGGDPFVVGKVECSRLDSCARFAAGCHFIDHTNGRKCAEFRVPIFRRDGEVILYLLQMP